MKQITEKDVRKQINKWGLKKWDNWGDISWDRWGGYFVRARRDTDEIEIVEFLNMGEFDKAWEGQAKITRTFLPYSSISDEANKSRGVASFMGVEKGTRLQKIFGIVQGWNSYYGADGTEFEGDLDEGVAKIEEMIEGA
jgi:hypothetical protein